MRLPLTGFKTLLKSAALSRPQFSICKMDTILFALDEIVIKCLCGARQACGKASVYTQAMEKGPPPAAMISSSPSPAHSWPQTSSGGVGRVHWLMGTPASPGSVTNLLCGPGEYSSCFWASVSSKENWLYYALILFTHQLTLYASVSPLARGCHLFK